MSTLKVDTIAANTAGSISISTPIAMSGTASVTGTLSTAAISSTGTISTSGELDAATLDISGNGALDGQLNVGSLIVAGNLSASGILVDGEELRPHVFAFGSFSGSTLAGGKNCTAVIDSAGTLTVTFTTAATDSNYVVLSSSKDQANPVQVSSKSTASFEISNVPTAGVDFLVVALLGSQGDVTAALPAVSLDNLTDVDLTGLDDNEVLVYDLASGKFKPEPAASGTGTVTQIVAGTGLTGGTITGSGTIAHQAQPTTGTGPAFVKSIEIDALGHVASVTGDTDASGARGTLGLGDSATKAVGTTSGTVCAGDDSRLTDARTPTAHTQALSTITDAGTSASLDVASSGDATSSQVVKGNDTRLTDARTPTTTLDHDADKITTGILPVARGGTGLSAITTLLNSNTTKSDVGLGNVENTAISTFSGSSNITQVGTITSGTWGGTAIAYADLSGTPTLGSAAAAATGDFEASGSIATHNAITTAHGISAFGSTLVDDADAAAARATLGAAPTNHEHSGSQITSGVVADDYVDLRPDMGATFDGQGSVVQGSKTVLVPVERPGVITAAALVGDAVGSITIDVKRYTPSGLGTLGSATTMGSISVSSRQHIRDTTLSGWTTSVSAGDVLSFTTSGTIATVTRVTVKVKIEDS